MVSSILWAVRSCSRVYPPVLAAQPLAIEQMGAGELHADAGPAQVRDRFAVAALGGVALAEQGVDAGFDPQRPVGACRPRAFGQPPECRPDERFVVRAAASASSGTT